jgi:hypothetical protein
LSGAGISDTKHLQVGAGKFETGVQLVNRTGGFDIVVDAMAIPPTAVVDTMKK